MPKLIRLHGGAATWGEDPFTLVDDDQLIPPGDVMLSLKRFEAEGRGLAGQCRAIGVRLAADEAPETLAADLSKLSVIALMFPKFRDGRAYSAARILRERLGFAGELRAVGDALVDMAPMIWRCGFDAVEPADASGPEDWTRGAHRFRHVYQRAADARAPAFAERGGS